MNDIKTSVHLYLLQNRTGTTSEIERALGIYERGANRALAKLRLEGVAVPIGKSVNTVWCVPEAAAEVTAQIEAKQSAIREATRLRSMARKAAVRDSWAERAPVQRIVPASAAKPPKVSVRCVWDLAA